MHKTFEYRLYPTRIQTNAMTEMLETHRRLYNAALEHRITAYKMAGVHISCFDQILELTGIRQEDAFIARTNFSSCQQTLRRLDKAFTGFFRRFKVGKKAGFPRFKSRQRFRTVTYARPGDGCALNATERRVYFQHIGQIKVKWHRPLEGIAKTVSFTRKADGWYLTVACNLNVEPSPSSNPPGGIDLGLLSFIATSDGETIPAPRLLRVAQIRLRRAQRHVARCKRGSNRRKKAVQRVAVQHQHVANARKDFHHKTARTLVNQYGLIAVEKLEITNIARGHFAKSTLDAGWGQFLSILSHKAANAGVQVIAVDPRFTSQTCSACGTLVPKGLAVRTHCCPTCGFIADRDVNAAQNILRLGLSRQALTAPLGAVV